MTLKFLNFYVLNLAEPGKTLKTSLHHQHLIKHMKRKRTMYTMLCHCTVYIAMS